MDSERDAVRCKREWRALVWAAEREIHGRDSAGDGGGGGIVKGAISRAAGDADFLQGMAAGGGAADAAEQPRSGGGGEAGRVGLPKVRNCEEAAEVQRRDYSSIGVFTS